MIIYEETGKETDLGCDVRDVWSGDYRVDDMELDTGSVVEGNYCNSYRIRINISFIFMFIGKKKVGIGNFTFNIRGIGTEPPERVGSFNRHTFGSHFGVDKFDQLK